MIHTSTHQHSQPQPITCDSRGNKIIVGARIAYNKSGGVVVGYIDHINKNIWKPVRAGIDGCTWWSLKFEIVVKNEEGNISKINNANSFIVI
jgi:hypothetical protein